MFVVTYLPYIKLVQNNWYDLAVSYMVANKAMIEQYYQSLKKCAIDTEDNGSIKAFFHLSVFETSVISESEKLMRVWLLRH